MGDVDARNPLLNQSHTAISMSDHGRSSNLSHPHEFRRNANVKCEIQVNAVLNVPCQRNYCQRNRRRERRITVKVEEIAADQDESLPANFIFKNFVVQENGAAEYDGDRRYASVHCVQGWRLKFQAYDAGDVLIGSAEIDTVDLARKNRWRLLLSNPDTEDACYSSDNTEHRVRCPTFLDVIVGAQDNLDEYPQERPRDVQEDGGHRFRKRVMIMTRGTRGDVQPYVALARGLAAEPFNCEVTIVTELAWKQFITESRAGATPGSIHFRPSGGNTVKQTRTNIAVLALKLGQHMDTLQSIFLSKSEQNFFASEGCFYHWAAEEKPDFIIFSFTVTHLAMIISESLGIPIVGFFLQPAHEIESRPPSDGVLGAVMGPARENLNGTEFNAVLAQLIESIPEGGVTLNRLRTSRGLGRFPNGLHREFLQYTELTAKRVPQIVPINPLVLCRAKQEELEREGMTLTDFIFLRGVEEHLDERIKYFIQDARRSSRKIVVIAFSSMPVGERKILQVARHICNNWQGEGALKHRPAVIAFVKDQEFDPITPSSELQREVESLEEAKRLLVWKKGAPFGLLFPEVDAVVTQGGLGTTSEALLAGIPAVISGILLMDQRYWAKRVEELFNDIRRRNASTECIDDSYPAGIYIDEMLSINGENGDTVKAVDVMRRALGATDEAKTVQQEIKEARDQRTCHGSEHLALGGGGLAELKMELTKDDGIAWNAYKVFEAGCTAQPLRNVYGQYRGCQGCRLVWKRTLYNCTICLTNFLTCFLCRQVPGCLICLLRLVAVLGVLLAPVALGAAFGFGVAVLAWGLTFWLWGICCEDCSLGAAVVSIVFFGTWILVGILSAWMIRRQMLGSFRDVRQGQQSRTTSAMLSSTFPPSITAVSMETAESGV